MSANPAVRVAAAVCAALAWFGAVSALGQPEVRPGFELHMTDEEIGALLEAWDDDLPYVPGELLVRFAADTPAESASRALGVLRGRVRSVGRSADVVRLATPDEPDAEQAAAIVRRQPEVVWAQPNYLRRLYAVPDDPGYERQWHLRIINIERAWAINDGATEEVVVAVVDSGVTTVTETTALSLWTGQLFESLPIAFRVNPDLDAPRIRAGRDFVFWTGPVVDMVGHGTHIAGTILQATHNGIGSAGIAHRATLLPLKACYGYWELMFYQASQERPGFTRPTDAGGCPDAYVAQAIRYAADEGAHVVNLSLGGTAPAPVLQEALEYAVSRGAFVSIAAGNEYDRRNPVVYPARYAAELAGAVAVASVGSHGARASYSSTGSHIEVAAPGGDVQATGIGGAIYQVSLFGDDFDPTRVLRPRFDRYAETPLQGTSMAAAHVSGVAALLYAHGIRTPAAIEDALRRTARDLGAPGWDPEYGDGLIDAAAALGVRRGLGIAR